MTPLDAGSTGRTTSRRGLLTTITGGAVAGFAGCADRLGFRSDSIGDRDASPITDGTTAWPTGGFDAANIGHNPDVNLLEEAVQTRQLTTGGAGIFTFFGVGPAVVDDRIYYGTQGGDVICLRADGEELWRRSLDAPIGLQSTPTVTREVVYVYTSNGLVALDTDDGELLWKRDVWSYRGTPPVADGLVYGKDSRVVALDAETGRREWRGPREIIGSGLAVADGVAYATGANRDDGEIQAVADGEELWHRDDLGALYAEPAVDPVHVYICTNRGRLFALDRETGDTVWEFGRRGTNSTTPVVAHGQVYLGSGNGSRTTCLDAETGDVLWRLSTGVYHDAPVAVGDGVYFGTPNEGLFAVTPDGTVRWHDEEFRISGSMAATGEALYATPFAGPFGSGDLYQLRR